MTKRQKIFIQILLLVLGAASVSTYLMENADLDDEENYDEDLNESDNYDSEDAEMVSDIDNDPWFPSFPSVVRQTHWKKCEDVTKKICTKYCIGEICLPMCSYRLESNCF